MEPAEAPQRSGMQWWQWGSLLCFIIGMIYTMVTVSKAAASSDTKKDMTNAITNVTIVNILLILILAGTAFFYLNSNIGAERIYVIVMLHVSLLLSIISVSVSSLQQLNAS